MIYIDNQEKLDQAIKEMSKAKCLAVDTEADSLHHYYEKMCLLQIGVSEKDFVIDTLCPLDFKKLVEVMSQKELVLHGADFDLKMLYKKFKFVATKVFDTLLAAQFLGYPKPSLAALVEKHFQVKLPKTNQKADWSKRPLTESMIEYAGNDTHYLLKLKDILIRELTVVGRLDWFNESCGALMSSITRRRPRDIEMPWRVKGSKDLKGRELIFLRELWTWREKEAQRRDRPRFKVLSTEQLLGIAKWVPQKKGSLLQECPSIPRSFNIGKVDSMQKTIDKAWQMPIDGIEKPKPKKDGLRFSSKQKEVLQTLKKERRRIAEGLKCDPSLICSNATLETLVAKNPKSAQEMNALKILLGWQSRIVLVSFLKILGNNGRT